MKASDLLLKCLEREGIDTIYGVPGEENADVMISLLTSKIKFITCRHEQSAIAKHLTHLVDQPSRFGRRPQWAAGFSGRAKRNFQGTARHGGDKA